MEIYLEWRNDEIHLGSTGDLFGDTELLRNPIVNAITDIVSGMLEDCDSDGSGESETSVRISIR